MAWKLEADGKSITTGESGQPLWVADDEGADKKPVEVNWASALQTISRLNGENKERREKAEELTTQLEEAGGKLKPFDGIDPLAAKEAITKLESIKQGELLTADKVESFKTSILQAAEAEKTNLIKGYDEKLNGFAKSIGEKDAQIYKMVISNAFANSPGVKKFQAPAAMIEAFFGHYFKVEDGEPIAYMNGNKINSRTNPGNAANFDEAIEIIVEQYPEKDKLFPGSRGGSGSAGGSQGGSQGFATGEQVKNMTIQEYEIAKKAGLVKLGPL